MYGQTRHVWVNFVRSSHDSIQIVFANGRHSPPAPKLPERCHPLTRPRIPSLVRIGWVLPDLFRKLCNMLSITAHPSLQRPFPITENQTVTKDGYHYSDNSTISIRYGCVVELSYATARHRQETQLSQRDRSMLRDTEYFALNHSSLKDIQNHILE